jgi:hypothetical protein
MQAQPDRKASPATQALREFLDQSVVQGKPGSPARKAQQARWDLQEQQVQRAILEQSVRQARKAILALQAAQD